MNPLARFFKNKGVKPTPWAKKNKISPAVVSRYLRGIGRLSPKNAFKIEKAANNEVTALDLLKSQQN